MPKAPRPWTLDDPEPLRQHAENLWTADGGLPGMPLRRRMVVVRLSDGRLVIHNAICLTEPEMQRLDALGPVAFLIVPNAWHRLDAAAWAARYRTAQVVCPRQAAKKVAEVVRVDGDWSALPADPTCRAEPLDGCKAGEAALIVHSADGVSVAFGDAVMNNPHGKGLWWRLYRLTDSTGGPRVTRPFKWMAVHDKHALRLHLLRLAELPGLRRVIPCHGVILDGAAAAEGLRVAAGRLA